MVILWWVSKIELLHLCDVEEEEGEEIKWAPDCWQAVTDAVSHITYFCIVHFCVVHYVLSTGQCHLKSNTAAVLLSEIKISQLARRH